MAFDLHVNVLAKSNDVEFTRKFTDQRVAEAYIRLIDNEVNYHVTEFNFTQKYTNEQLDEWEALFTKIHKEANRLQRQALHRSINNEKNPELFPCEVCNKKHPNWNCCPSCNYDRHICHFCGENLGHTEVSVCYMLDGWGE